MRKTDGGWGRAVSGPIIMMSLTSASRASPTIRPTEAR